MLCSTMPGSYQVNGGLVPNQQVAAVGGFSSSLAIEGRHLFSVGSTPAAFSINRQAVYVRSWLGSPAAIHSSGCALAKGHPPCAFWCYYSMCSLDFLFTRQHLPVLQLALNTISNSVRRGSMLMQNSNTAQIPCVELALFTSWSDCAMILYTVIHNLLLHTPALVGPLPLYLTTLLPHLATANIGSACRSQLMHLPSLLPHTRSSFYHSDDLLGYPVGKLLASTSH